MGSGASLRSYSYDANGAMVSRALNSTTSTFSWTTFHQPATLAGAGVSTTFGYGPDHQRWQTTATYANANGANGTETTVYVGGLFEYETTAAQTHYKHFIPVPGGSQIIYDLASVSGAVTTYVIADHLGSGSLFLNSAGTKLIQESYSAFGYRRSADWSAPLNPASSDYVTIATTTRRGYTSAFHEVLDNLGLINMNGRVYDPTIGRLLSPDPNGDRVGTPQDSNPYAYAMNSPLRFTDPTGYEVLGAYYETQIYLSKYGSPSQRSNAEGVLAFRSYALWAAGISSSLGLGGFSDPSMDFSGSGYWYEPPGYSYDVDPDGTPVFIAPRAVWVSRDSGNSIPLWVQQDLSQSASSSPNSGGLQPPSDAAQGKAPTGCKSESAWGKAAEIMDKGAKWSSNIAIGSGAAALVTSETVVGGIGFGAVAAGAETTSLVLSGASAAANAFDRNGSAFLSSAVSFGISFVVPRGLQSLAPAEQGFGGELRRQFGDWLSKAEGELAARGSEAVLCP